MDERQQNYLDQVPKRYQARMESVLKGDAGYAGAVRMKCCDCMGFEETTKRVRECSTTQCPLWQYRPYQKDGEEE